MRSTFFAIGLLLAANLYAQRDAFILTDVSGSVKDASVIIQSRDIIGDMLNGNLNMGNYSGWRPLNIADNKIQDIIDGQGQPLAANGSYICIMPFGNKDRYKEFTTLTVNQFPDELNTFLAQNFPISHSDNYTYIQIAQAYTAELAKRQNIKDYYLFIVTDDLGDQENTNSHNTYDSIEQDFILSWNNALFSNVISLGSFKNDDLYVHIKKVTLTVQASSSTPPPEPARCEIRLVSYPGGKPGQETKVKSEMISLSWSCPVCPAGTQYLVSVASTDGHARNNIRKNVQSTSYTAKISNGKYKITISAPACKSDSTYIQVKSGGGSGGGLIALLLLLGVGAGGYFIWKMLQDKKLKKLDSRSFAEDKDEPVIIRKKESDDPELF